MNNEPDYKDNLAFDPARNMPTCDLEKLKSDIEILKAKVKQIKPELSDWADKFGKL